MHRVVYRDVVGAAVRPDGLRLSAAGLSAELAEAFQESLGYDATLTPPQSEALRAGILRDRAHFIVSTPTNSGKTLIALMRIFERALTVGGRYVLVVPLKALAEEKVEELRALSRAIWKCSGRTIDVGVSTGDYQLTEDFPDSPPQTGQVLVCTPERLEVILRNPANVRWSRSVDTFVLDEFHLLGDKTRGARFETLVTRILCLCPKSSIVALSATFGPLERLRAWFAGGGLPVNVVDSDFRYPALERLIVCTDDKDQYILDLARQLDELPEASLLIFVYRKSDAESLAKCLGEEVFGPERVASYHSDLALEARRGISRQFRDGSIQAVVATTSLKMGVNTPATHVIVRDTVFHGSGRLPLSDLLQMIGRAGRGARKGTGVVLCTQLEDPERYVAELLSGVLSPIRPQLIRSIPDRSPQVNGVRPVRSAILSEIAFRREVPSPDLVGFLARTYSGLWHPIVQRDVQEHLTYLESSKLIYRVENSEATFAPSRLGRTVSYAGLSAETGAVLGAFLRGLIQLGQSGEREQQNRSLLQRLSAIDFLFLAVGSFEVRDKLLRVGRNDVRWTRVQEVLERLSPEDKPLVNLWREPESTGYPTRRLLATLRFDEAKETPREQDQVFRRLMTTAVMLFGYSRGQGLGAVQRDFGVAAGALERDLKPTVTWILNGLAQICSSKKCYKLEFLALRIFELIEDLMIGAQLGKLVSVRGFGRRSAEKLIAAGVRDLSDPRLISAEALAGLGLARKQVSVVIKTVRRGQR